MGENSAMSVLSQRYASQAMRDIWSPEAKIIAERKLWIAVMRAQSGLGHAIAASVISDYEKVINKKWTSEMFVMFCEELHQEMIMNEIYNESNDL